MAFERLRLFPSHVTFHINVTRFHLPQEEEEAEAQEVHLDPFVGMM